MGPSSSSPQGLKGRGFTPRPDACRVGREASRSGCSPSAASEQRTSCSKTTRSRGWRCNATGEYNWPPQDAPGVDANNLATDAHIRPSPSQEGRVRTKTVSGLPEAEEASFSAAVGLPLLAVVLYFSTGTLFFHLTEGWSCTEAFYFCAETIATVGFGDLLPSNAFTQGFTVFFILFGVRLAETARVGAICYASRWRAQRNEDAFTRDAQCRRHYQVIVIFPIVSSFVQFVLQPLIALARKPILRVYPPTYVDVDGDGQADYELPGTAAEFYLKGIVGPAIVVTLIQALSAAFFTAVEGWHYGTSLYYCFITALTVGFGDNVVSMWRVAATIHILLSAAALGALIADVGVLRARRRQLLLRAERLRLKLDPALIASLDRDGTGDVDK